MFKKVCFKAVYIGACFASAHSALAQGDADRLLAGNHFLRAQQLLRTQLQRNPNDAHALSDLSVVDWSFRRLDESLANAEKAVALDPNSVDANSRLGDALGSKLVSSNAGTMQKISLAHRFRKQIDRTLELDPNDLDSLQDLAQFLWHAPGMVGGDKSKGRETADKLFKISPFRGASARADFLTDETDTIRRNAATVAVWQEAVRASPQDFDAHAALAAACLEVPSQLAVAESEAKRAIELDRSRIDGFKVLATVYARTGRWNELDAMLKQARAGVPDDRGPEFVAALAILNGSAGPQLPLAEQMLRDYLAQPAEGLEPTHAVAHWRLGLVLEKQGRKADAVRELQMAVQQDGSLDGAKKDLKRLS